jgi:hypothetical protein
MSLFLFRLVVGRLYCLSCDPSGGNLPHGFRDGGWAFVRRMDVLPGEVRVGFDSTAVAAAVAEDGYVLIGSPYHAD